MKTRILFVLISILFLWACSQSSKESATDLSIQQELFGYTEDGRRIDVFTLKNRNGMQVRIINYGAIVQSIVVPDRRGNMEDVVLGYDDLQGYLNDKSYFGAIVGRYANRIAKGRFTLDGVEYKLATNDGENHLHGGIKGFNKKVWNAKPLQTGKAVGVELRYLSKDGEEGYPGNLNVTVTYTLNDSNALKIDYLATTDKATPVNLTNHSYFNLIGNCQHDILKHILWINADYFTPVDQGLIPTGELQPVKGTPMDFTTPTMIGKRIDEDYEQLKFGRGYDHNWVLNDVDGTLKLQASLYEPSTGRYLEVYTTEPGVQFYSGNFLDGSVVGKRKTVYRHRFGLSLETQHFPDSPNHPNFPSTILRPGETYRSTTVYKFSTK